MGRPIGKLFFKKTMPIWLGIPVTMGSTVPLERWVGGGQMGRGKCPSTEDGYISPATLKEQKPKQQWRWTGITAQGWIFRTTLSRSNNYSDSKHVHAWPFQPCLTLCSPTDCSLPGSSVHGILQARLWSGWPFPTPGDLPDLRHWTHGSCSSCTGRWILYHWATREDPVTKIERSKTGKMKTDSIERYICHWRKV